MKVLKIVLISFAVLIVVLLVAAAIIINSIDLNKFKPQIVEQADKALARKVDFRDAHLGVGFNGIGVKLRGLSVSEDPAFGPGDFLRVKEISVGVDVLGFLLRRQISITGIRIDEPSVTIIRNKDGSVNAQTIAKAPAAPAALPPAQGEARGQASALPALFVSSLKGQNGSVHYIDRSFDPPVRLDVSALSFTVDRLSLSEPFPFSAQAQVLSDGQNIRVTGKCQVDPKTMAVKVSDLKADSDLARLSLKKIPQALPMVAAQALPEELKGTVVVNLVSLTAGSAGLEKMDCAALLSNGMLRMKEMGQPVTAARGEVLLNEKDITVKELSAAIGQGNVNASGWLKNYAAGQDFDFSMTAEKLSIPDLYDQKQLPVKAEGIIDAKGQVKGHGFTPEALRTNLVGNADINITGAKLKDLNVLKTVLDSLSVIPGLGASLEAGLPEAYKQKLAQKDTSFNDIKVPVTIVSGKVVISETTISSEGMFTFQAKGDAGFDGSYSLEGTFLLPADLSRAMAGSVAQMQYLMNPEGMIFIPLKVSGKAGARMQFTVDAAYITRKLLENQAQQQIMKGLNRIFGGQDQPQQPGSSGQPQPSQQSEENNGQDPGKAVGDLLHGLFGK